MLREANSTEAGQDSCADRKYRRRHGTARHIKATLSLLNEDGSPSAFGTSAIVPAFITGLRRLAASFL